jgi:aerobic carbon-monoxide dehydrogenase large subunit
MLAEIGQLPGSLMDYALPRADDLPPFEVTPAEQPTSVKVGVKGAGQAADRPQRDP